MIDLIDQVETAFHSLPLKNTDVFVVTIGEDGGANIMVSAYASQCLFEKLSTIMGLFNGKLKGTTHLDSMMVQFIVLGNGQITGLESVGLL